MKMIQDEAKIGLFENLYFFMIVIYTAMAIPFTKCMMAYYKEPIGFAIPIIMTSILLFRNKVNFNNRYFFSIIAIYTIWVIFQYAKYNHFTITLTFFVYYNIVIAYIIIDIYKTKIFLLYENIVTKLSVFAIIGWLLMVLVPGSFGHFIDLIKMPHSDSGLIQGNIIIFSMTNLDSTSEFESFGLVRNTGFSWEPGRYASMLIIAIFFNMARNQFQFQLNRNIGFWILTLALLTTQSTTGFMSFSILIIWFLINKNISTKILSLALIIPLAIFVYSLPFIGEKLNLLMDQETTMSKVDSDLEIGEDDLTYVPQRFDGLSFEFLNIVSDPLLGYGNDEADSYTKRNISPFLGLSNGILKVFARFGIILGCLFYFLLFRSSFWFSNFYNIKGGMVYMLLFLAISISYDFTLIPFFLSIVFFSLFADRNLKYLENETEILM